MFNNSYVNKVYSDLSNRYPNEKEFLQAAYEILKSLEVIVNKRPEIEKNNLLERFNAYDNYDGDLTEDIEVLENTYDQNYNKPGNYLFKLKVVDSSGNITIRDITVKVIDETLPIFGGPTKIDVATSSPITVDFIKSQLTLSDNVDGNITGNIKVKTDGYTGNERKIGDHKVVFEGKDSAGNTVTHTVTVTVTDGDKPYFVLDGFFLNISQKEILTQEQIVDVLISMGKLENIDENYNVVLDEYTGNENNPGVYRIRLASGKDIYEFNIKVYEDINSNNISDNQNNNYIDYVIILGSILVLGSSFVVINRRKKRKAC